jgi:hypothetical protein
MADSLKIFVLLALFIASINGQYFNVNWESTGLLPIDDIQVWSAGIPPVIEYSTGFQNQNSSKLVPPGDGVLAPDTPYFIVVFKGSLTVQVPTVITYVENPVLTTFSKQPQSEQQSLSKCLANCWMLFMEMFLTVTSFRSVIAHNEFSVCSR